MRQFQWAETTLAGVIRHGDGRQVAGDLFTLQDLFEAGDCSEGVLLSDGTAVVACSDWSGTKDALAEPPRFWIGTPIPGGVNGNNGAIDG